MSNIINITLDGKTVEARTGETILDVARQNNIEIPTLCHDPRLKPYTSCYVCVVEVQGLRGLQPSCSTKITDGMKIETNNEKVRKGRKTALDLMLSNHYADCTAQCKQTCPAGVDIQGYISHIDKGQYHEAVALIKETNPLPAICGRICVRPCEVACRRNLLNEGAPVGIDYMKRFASDYDLESKDKYIPDVQEKTGKKVAVIGAGPGGLSAAFFLQKSGHQVDIFEAAPAAGGWLRYGIPEYRLPNDILQKEVDNITDLGVNIFYNKKFGENLKYKEITDNYDATILTIGSQKGTLIGCEGDDAGNVFSGIDFLKEMEVSGKPYDFKGKKVAVVGGGNTAMDCCRTSIRCGSTEVYVIYRRTEKEMPANPIEIHESKIEGVQYKLLTNPVKVNKDENGNVKSVTCLKMELGEPDASGRRRPVPVVGSEFDLEVDYILAAIGQKTQVDFLDDINGSAKDGELKLNRWGDIDANPDTLQTGISSVFAAGDGVTGPATVIEAIAQAKTAAISCNQYLYGKEIIPPKKEFLSKKDNFKVQDSSVYEGCYPTQLREEMPTLAADNRINFDEVELGYANEEVAQHEAQRCLECGCVKVFNCDLKDYATEYEVEQNKYGGEYNEYKIDFRHPFIEIDNNKCILCSRCIRICKEVVGADALGLVNRGFNTYVAPSMGDRLQDSNCESCGLCISTCPTGSITENVLFKPGPIKTDSAKTICNYCSVGCEIVLNHKSNFVMKVTGNEGLINKDGNICRYPKFGFNYLNDNARIKKPLLKENGKFREISFKKAYDIIAEKISQVKPDENAFFAGARLTNEEMYLIQKLARAGVKTNNVTSLHYLNRGDGYTFSSRNNVPFDQINQAGRIYLIGSEINEDNAVTGFMINNAQFNNEIPIELITTNDNSSMLRKVDNVLKINSYYHFIKAVNYYLVANNFHNAMYIADNCEAYEEYKEEVLKENFGELVRLSGVPYMDIIVEFAKSFNNEMNAVIVFSEKEISANASYELFNLCMITGKLGKTASGLISLKEKNNSQGLFDMGICPKFGVGTRPIDDPKLVKLIKEKWKVDELPDTVNESQFINLEEGRLKNLFIFGEDPLGTAKNVVKMSGWISVAEFLMVQDSFITKTAEKADLILPASFPIESGGSFANTQKVLQEFNPEFEPGIDKLSYQQLTDIIKKLGVKQKGKLEEIRMEAMSLLSVSKEEKLKFVYTNIDNYHCIFNFGCDSVNRYFEKEFESALAD